MIDQLITALNQEMEFSAEDIADTIWLALQINPSPSVLTDNLLLPNNQNQPPSDKHKPQSEEKESLEEDRNEDKNEDTNDDKNDASEQEKAVISPSQQGEGLKNSELRFNAPNARSLREPLPLARALKPLMRRIPSGTNLILDEIATTQQVANEGLWLPVLKPRVEPWLDLELLVDESISMQIWRSTIRELEKLLKNYGIFRNVRIWGLIYENTANSLENQPKTSKISIRRGLGKTAKNQPLRSPKELIDPTNRRLLLLATDCVSDLWRNNEMRKILDLWANNLPMAIVQMLPKWLWERTTLGRESEIRLKSLTAGVANKSLIAKEISLWDELDEEKGIKMPIFTLEANRVGTWAEMLVGKGNVKTVGYSLDKDISQRKNTLFNQNKTELTPEERVQRFRVTASPVGRKLAGLLSASPVISLPVVRLIRETMLRNSEQVNVAEVFLGGLLKPLWEINADTNPDTVLYDFMDGVRDLFLNTLPSDYVFTILDQVSKYIAKKAGLSLAEFTAVLRKQRVFSGDISVEKIDYFATITAQVLRSLGDKYAKFADDLDPDYNPYSEDDTQTSLSKSTKSESFRYQVGGALGNDEPSYVTRESDRLFYEALKAGEFCYVLNSRQMGRTSLMVRTLAKLQADRWVGMVLDFSAKDSQISQPDRWYNGIINQLNRRWRLLDNARSWIKERDFLSPVERLEEFIETALLSGISQPIVIFIDEINSTLNLPFTDDFFALIRSCYNKRAKNPDYKRLTFALLGVATPTDLISDKERTPFSIGRAIDLKGFKLNEVFPLSAGLTDKVEDTQTVLQEILKWTGGQPFLTQRLCQLVVNEGLSISTGKEAETIANITYSYLIENWESQDEQEHLKTIKNRLLSNERTAGDLLELYRQIRQAKEFPAQNSSEERALQLSGLVVKRGGKLKLYNPIYEQVFNESWINAELSKLRPYPENFRAWVASGKVEPSWLLKGKALEEAEAWAEDKNLSGEDRDFLSASRTQRREEEIAEKEKEAALERERQAKEAAEKQVSFSNINQQENILYPLYFGTNRKPINKNNLSQGFSIERDSQVNHGICDVLIPLSHTIGSTGLSLGQRLLKFKLEDDRLKLKKDSIRLLTTDDSLVTMSDNHQILVLIHGINTNFENVAVRAAQIGYDLAFRGIMAFYSWPSQGKLEAYIPDLKTLEASETYIKEFLLNLAQINKRKKIHIIAHSISNQALLRVISQIFTEHKSEINFGQIFLTGADVDPSIFATLAPACINLAERVTLYISSKDRTLQTLKRIHGNVAPIGLYPPITIVEGIDTIDVSQIDNSLLGHNYYAGSEAVLSDMRQLLINNTPPENRSGLESRITEDNKIYWVMSN